MNLSGLTTVRRSVYYSHLTFTLASGGTLNLPVLQSIDVDAAGSNGLQTFFVLGPGPAAVSLPALTQMHYTAVSLPPGTTFSAPALTDLSDSSVTLSGGTLATSPLTRLDAASVAVSGGATFANVAAVAIDDSNVGGAILAADGAGSLLDLHTVQSLTFGGGNDNNVTATSGGTVNLAGLTAVRRSVYYAHLTFAATGGGTVRLPNLQTVNADTVGSNGIQTYFDVTAGGTMTLGNVISAQYAAVNVADPTSKLTVAGSLNLGSTCSFNAGAGATVSVGGTFSFAMNSTSSFQAAGATLLMNGTGPQTLEVGGVDAGAVNPANNGNFGFGQLRVGTATVPTEVDLTDTYNNGNRGGSAGTAEALYLFGTGSQNGLVLSGGSYLVLNNLDAYTYQDGSWVSLQSLFPAGQTVVSYTANGSYGYLVKSVASLTATYTAAGNGSFDVGGNFSTGVAPGMINAVVLNPATAGTVVAGPAGNVQVRSLLVDGPPTGANTVLNLNGAGTLAVSTAVQVGPHGSVDVAGGGLTAAAVNLAGGTVAVSAGSLSAGTLAVGGGGLSIAGGTTTVTAFTQAAGTTTVAGGSFAAASANVSGGVVAVSGGQFTATGGLVVAPVGAAVNLSGGTLSVGSLSTSGNPAAVNWTAGTLAITGPAGLTWDGTSPVGTPTLSAGKSLVVTNALAVPANGLLTVAGGTASAGTLSVAAGGNLSLSAGAVSAAALTQTGGTFTQTGGAVTAGSFEVDGGTLTQSAGSIAATGAYTQTGGVVVLTGGSFAGGTATLVGGTAYVLPGSAFSTAGPAAVVAAGTLDLAGGTGQVGGSLSVAPGGTVNVTGGTFNAGTVAVVGGTLNVAGGTVMAAAGNVSGGSLAVGPNGRFTTPGTLALTATAGPVVTLTGGTLSAGTLSAGTLTGSAAGLVDWTSGTVAVTAGGLTVGPGGPLGSTLSLSSGMTLGVAGTTAVTGQLTLAGGTLTTAALAVAAGGLVAVRPSATVAGRQLVVVPALSVAPSGRVDLSDNDLDVTAGDLAAVTALARQGYAGGTWAGPGGLASSSAAADATRRTALGVVGNNQGGSPLYTAARPFDGVSPGAADVLVKYTYYGDANLDGVVDGADYARIDAGFLGGGALTGWYNGDFNYDGRVDASDYTLIDNAFNTQTVNLAASADPAGLSAAATDEVGAVAAAVPEPSSAGVAVVALLAGRRRRR